MRKDMSTFCFRPLQVEIGLIAVNDAMMLESCVYSLINWNFKDKKSYANSIKLMHEVCTAC